MEIETASLYRYSSICSYKSTGSSKLFSGCVGSRSLTYLVGVSYTTEFDLGLVSNLNMDSIVSKDCDRRSILYSLAFSSTAFVSFKFF